MPLGNRNRNGRPHAAPGRGRIVHASSFLGGLMLLISAFTGIGSPAIATSHYKDPARSLEYRVKAAFIFNFAKFVQWPGDAFEDQETPVTIGIVGEDPFGSILEETVGGRTIQGRKIAIKRFGSIEQAHGCHMLFISDSQAEQLQHVFSVLDDLPVLTIGETEFFAENGGMIGFFITENRVKFKINLETARRSRLKISSKLLKLARIVHDERWR